MMSPISVCPSAFSALLRPQRPATSRAERQRYVEAHFGSRKPLTLFETTTPHSLRDKRLRQFLVRSPSASRRDRRPFRPQVKHDACHLKIGRAASITMPPLDPEDVTGNDVMNDVGGQSQLTQSIQPLPASTPPTLRRRSSYSAKRSRAFDDRYVLPPCTTPAKSELAAVEAFVESAISEQNQSYRSIIDCLRKRNDATMLYRLLVVLRINGTTLHQLIAFPKRHNELLHTIFRLDPFVVPAKMANDEDFHRLVQNFSLADAYLHFLMAIVSANSTFLQPALNSLWKMLVVNSQTDESLLEARTQRLHCALATLLRLVPKGSADLLPIVASNFPFRSRPTVVDYAKYCFSVMDYAPTLEPQMLELLIDKALEIDVEIRIKDGGNVEIDEEKIVSQIDDEAIFELELDGDVPQKATAANTEAPHQDNLLDRTIDEMAEKLDSIMVLLFRYVESRVENDPQALSKLFHILVPVFESTILTTHRSKFVQFILFYLCGIVPSDVDQPHDLYRDFAGRLIEAVLDPLRATVTRQSAACYLASFVSRANYACPETTCEVVSALLRWAETYMAVLEQGTNTPGRNDVRSLCELHSLFYTVCQAAFYIMCFRGTDAVQYFREAVKYWENTDKTRDSLYPDLDHIDIAPERWEKVCGHKLQPLRFCLESVREEFIFFAESFTLLPPKLLKNLDLDAQLQSSRPKRRGKLINTPVTSLAGRRQTGGVGGLGRGSNPLDSFFPFDPYLLKQSHIFVDSLYRNWEGRVDGDDVMLEDSDDDADLDDGHDVESDDDDDDDTTDASEAYTHMPVSADSTVFLQSMSHNSGATSVASSDVPMHSPGLSEYRQAQAAWSGALKRPRAPSIAENGSW